MALRLIEPGLWTSIPDTCWALETRVIEKQEAPFVLLAPDEPAARHVFMKRNPKLATMRKQLLERYMADDMFVTATHVPDPDRGPRD